jgi:LacI family transcriptional regulator
MEGGMAAFEKLWAQSARPTAVICSNDMTAIGVMRKGHEFKLWIPNDLSVIGFDDIRLAQFMVPPLTTIQMSQAELARIAFDALMADVERENPSPTGTEYLLRTNLILRQSTQLNTPRVKSTG